MPSWFKDSVPQFLYKYVTRDRWDVLKNREIRFTQFDDFNDPFETQHKSRVSEVRSFQSYDTMRSRDYWSTAMTGWTEDRYRSAVSNWTDKDLERRKKELRRQEYIDASVPSLGVLSLAAIPDHLAMWTHYSAGFTGLVIKFDTSSSFFSTNLSRTWFQQHDDLFKLRRVRYESSVPSLRSFDPLESLEQIIFTKGENWSYEQEWRLCRPLAEGRIKEETEQAAFPIFLFPLPPSAIGAILFGYKMPEHDMKACLSAIRGDDSYLHIEFYRAFFKEGSYVVRLGKLC